VEARLARSFEVPSSLPVVFVALVTVRVVAFEPEADGLEVVVLPELELLDPELLVEPVDPDVLDVVLELLAGSLLLELEPSVH
jgi:hypothetical protein